MVANSLSEVLEVCRLELLNKKRVKELIAIKKINAGKIFNAWQNIVHIGNITV